jgi:dTDP-4-dehydrorhamnose 3,5-epimerase
MEFRDGSIEGVIWIPLKKYNDSRGWLCELFRVDDIPETYAPVMAYISETQPGICRGPHEHVEQADYFCFIGPGNFKVYLWDNRSSGATFRVKETRVVGIDSPFALIVPPGVVHAYKNVSAGTGLVVNCANRLYKGWGRAEPVDEIRHEEHADSLYKLD